MVNGIRASILNGLNKGHALKLRVGSRVQQETPEEGQETYWPKCCFVTSVWFDFMAYQPLWVI